MILSALDWFVIAFFLMLTMGIGIYYTRKAGQNTDNFFLGGRNLPWYIAGTSMVATTFAADTPLAVTEMVALNGIAGNWLWWNFLAGGMLTTFFFARLWRRAEVLTDLEFIEVRYSGKPAFVLRAFRAVYYGIFMNAIIIGWVNVALISLFQVFFGLDNTTALFYTAIAMTIVMIYSSMSGFLGVVMTDFIQFIIAMGGTIVLAFIVVNSEAVGGIAGLKAELPAWTFSYFPNLSRQTVGGAAQALTLSIGSFLAFTTVQWWASWYPGAEPGGGGYIAQRMMSTRSEKDAVYATLFFQVAHYCVRPWPWILVGLASLVLYPDLTAADKKLGYVMAMKDFLPSGLRGLLLVAFLSAYMSTISTQLNWGASYIVNDLYKRVSGPETNEKTLVNVSRIATVLLMLISLGVTTQIGNISNAWGFIVECGAGLGLVMILRWYWWRINAWSEIVATIAPFMAYAFAKYYLALFDPAWGKGIQEDPRGFFLTVGFTTLAWLVATFLTQPTHPNTLHKFYLKVEPQGYWKPVRQALKLSPQKSGLKFLFLAWFSAIVFAYSTLFLTGEIIFANWNQALIYAVLIVISIFTLRFATNRVQIF
ncbi:MAG: sodium:solute symporter family protein [Microscillaceae bacterium]|nr:sodium:solute symporter family protein [Microscillaceae bacterium]